MRAVALACTMAAFATPSGCQSANAGRSQFWGFAAPWDPASDASIRQHGTQLDAVVSGWIGLDSVSGKPLLPSPFADTLRPPGTMRMAIVTSWHNDRFHRRSILALARDRHALARTAAEIAAHARDLGYAGLVLDFETLERDDLEAQVAVMRAITDSARAHGVRVVAAAIPALDTLAYPTRPLLRVVDFVIPMLYDQHWAGSQPGPLAAPDWVRSALAMRVAEAGASRIVAGFPTYGYRWRRGLPTEDMGYAEAQRIAASTRTPLRRDAATGTLRATGADWEMWVTDAVLLRRLVADARALGVTRFAFWRLGREDDAIWRTLVRR